ncbi:hypothetical protein D9619_004767 [Psilocybe cf. subviscida]|uniref:Major facilitator superfamily (MFS) profile domain-containing protein n=1 Tax=Psilocybe cf. subviscida TaxID=2480587 RepID=A0A8H5BPN5_9AGAR|nr:hypothetical protein D9619_004767 [Psilocybe cf. subviscida]
MSTFQMPGLRLSPRSFTDCTTTINQKESGCKPAKFPELTHDHPLVGLQDVVIARKLSSHCLSRHIRSTALCISSGISFFCDRPWRDRYTTQCMSPASRQSTASQRNAVYIYRGILRASSFPRSLCPPAWARLGSDTLCGLPPFPLSSPPFYCTPFTMNATHDAHDDERTLLLEQQPTNKTRTPLDKLQIATVLVLQVCEPICSLSIYPYINELVSTLDIIGGDETKIGYYAGLIESLFFLTEALFVYRWSKMSDRIGRKPVLMIGMVGTMLSMLFFGLSRTFTMLVISRCLCGLLNGNVGVIRSTLGELTDTTNRADAFAFMPAVWAFGATMGSLMGGTLARPADQFPEVFTAKFWRDYPYFLSAAAPSAVVLVVVIFTALYFKETVPPSSSDTGTTPEHPPAHVPLSGLMTLPVILSIANYVTLAFLDISICVLLPLFLYMPIELGGLNLRPVLIGYVMALYGVGTACFQIPFFAKLVRRYGSRNLFIWSVASFLPAFTLFPVASLVAKSWGVNWGVWALVFMILFLLFFMYSSYGCIFMYVTESAPDRRSLGAVNGLAQTTVSMARAVGPALSTSLFSLSIQHNIMGGYGVYFIMIVFTMLALLLAVQLPEKMWGSEEEEST